MDLTSLDLKSNDLEGAFYHSYIPHSVTFPTIKEPLERVDPITAYQLEGLLTDLPIIVNSQSNNFSDSSITISTVNLESYLDQINEKIDKLKKSILVEKDNSSTLPGAMTTISNNDLLKLQTSLFLLDDSMQSYIKSNASNLKPLDFQNNNLNQIDYENALGLLRSSERSLSSVEGLDSNTLAESQLYYKEIGNIIKEKGDSQVINKLIDSLRNTYDRISPTTNIMTISNSDSNNNENSQYFNKIHVLLSKVLESIDKGNYPQASDYAIEAYLDNYEYLEAPIEKVNASLKNDLEFSLRESLIHEIDARQPLSEIVLLINKSITPQLIKAEYLIDIQTSKKDSRISILPSDHPINKTDSGNNFANIDSLREGFGIYTGEKKVIGDVSDSQKQSVRNKVDEIRLGLNDVISLYKQGEYKEAVNKARLVYLNSYENIEIPLRPINPDFTLDMEIKFAELRNQIQQKQPYEIVEKKVIEIRNGLDESERLVSGTGIIAPTIAFSSSMSIIFREGLESALIVGAMLTYLEASRNERFKKHIYFGILFAIGATALMWIIANHVIELTGASRELIEGVAGVSAVAVLFWVSFWVLNKIETKKWIEFVKSKVWQATTTGSVMVFILLSFFTIFREGFETVLFYQSMFSYAKYMESYVIAGLVIGLGIVILVAFVIKKMGKRLPLRILFGLTMGIGAYMSVAFIGNAVRSFQEVDYLSTTPMIGIIPRLDINMASMTGIHPTLESFVAQLVLLIIYVVGSTYVLVITPRRKRKIELSRKSMSDKTERV
jgi:high-affinity iron transporter